MDSLRKRLIACEYAFSNTDTLVIGLEQITLYMEKFVELSDTKGNLGNSSNKYFAMRLAALNLVDYKKKQGMQITEGFVYAISNPAWEGQLKVGNTYDPHRRLMQFQTYSPFRDFSLDHWSFFSDKFSGERIIHSHFSNLRDHEWLDVSGLPIPEIFREIKNKSIELLEGNK